MSHAKSIPKTRSAGRQRSTRSATRSVKVAPANSNKVIAGLCVLLAAASIAVYTPVFGHSFLVLDDREYVTANPHIRALDWDTIKWAFTSTVAANWHPLTWLSHALDYKLFELNPTGHHVTSVLIHALNAVLLFLGLLWLTRRTGPSLFVAALFAFHPLNVESVAWVAERKNVLSTLFFFLAIGAYAWYAKNPNWRRYLLMAMMFAAGLLAKPMLVTFPFVLLLLDYWPLERVGGKAETASPVAWSRAVLEKVPLLALSAASSWMTLKAQHAVVQTFAEYSLGNRVGNAVVSYGRYLWKMVWPAKLALYAHSPVAPPLWKWLLSMAVLAAITALVILQRQRKYLPVGWFWFLGTLVPVIGLVQVGGYAMADRYTYISLIGIFIMIAWSSADLVRVRQVSRAWCIAAATCVVAALAIVTVHQISYWQSDYALNAHTLELEETPFAHNAVAMSLLNPAAALTPQELERFSSESARVDEARRHFERALQLRQSQTSESSLWDKAGTLNNLANLDRMQNRLGEARQHDEAALRIYRQLAQENPEVYLPYLAVTLNNLGAVNRMQNQLDEARLDYEESLGINRELAKENPTKYLPNVAMVLNEYALVDATQNRTNEARQHYQEALTIDRRLAQQSPEVYQPELAMTLTNFALFEAYQRNLDGARQYYQEALKIHRRLAEQNSTVYLPDLAMTLGNLARVEQLQGRVQESRAHYREALSMLDMLSQGNGRYQKEIAEVRNALRQLDTMALPH